MKYFCHLSMRAAIAFIFVPIVFAEAAPCTLPNQLVNGQVTDASQVMANFNQLLNCVNSAISPTGTPSAGSLAQFSGSSSITNGDLTGDVTTSGSLATTLANSGVTAGSYASANITVDSKGRIVTASSGGSGGGGIPEAPWITPTVAGFQSTNIGTGTLSNFTEAGVSGVLLTAAATTTNTNNLLYGVNSIPIGVHGWRVTARIRRLTPLISWGMMGVVLRSSTAGSSVTFGLGVDSITGINRNQFSSDSKWNSVGGVVPWYDLDIWIRVYDDLTNRHTYVSKDGFDWQEIYTEPSGTYVAPDEAGIFMNPNFGNGNNISGKNPVGMKVYSLAVEAVP